MRSIVIKGGCQIVTIILLKNGKAKNEEVLNFGRKLKNGGTDVIKSFPSVIEAAAK
jgi:hypothetical protein